MCTKISARTSIQMQRRHPAFPARWLYGLYVLALVRTAFVSPSPATGVSLFASLPPASGRQAHTTSPYASCAHACCTLGVHRIVTHVRGVRERPSCRVRRGHLTLIRIRVK